MIAGIRSQLLFAPLLPWLARLGANRPVAIPELNHAARQAGIRVGTGVPLSFVAPGGSGMAYEERIHWLGEVEVRPDNWHDCFNALVWLTFPLAKAVINGRHHAAVAAQGYGSGVRGVLRDALTHFDECGVAVACAQPELGAAIRAHRWKEVFWRRRADACRSLQFFVFGHASYDLLRSPHLGLTAKALFVDVDADWLAAPLESRLARLDAAMAQRLGEANDLHPGDFCPLPLLGIPGATPDNEFPAYYDDSRQFRPLRRI